MLGPTKEEVLAARHEGWHGSTLYVLLGPDAVGSITRVPTDTHFGMTKLADLPGFRHPSLDAFDLAVVLLAPLAAGCAADGCRLDVSAVPDCAEVAYRYRPKGERGIGPEEWYDAWSGRAWRRAVEMVADGRVVALARALERAMDREPTLDPARARAVMAEADAELLDSALERGWVG